jgi:transposase
MSSTNRSFTKEFKKDAVDLANKIGGGKAAEQLGVSSKNIYRWQKEFSSEISVSQNELSPAELKKKIQELEKENTYIKKVNEVLKKSTAIFSNDQMPRF